MLLNTKNSSAEDEIELNSILTSLREKVGDYDDDDDTPVLPSPESSTKSKKSSVSYVQWQVLGNDLFAPTSHTIDTLKEGIYKIAITSSGDLLFQLISILNDDIIELPESSHIRVLESIRKFWKSKQKYKKHSLLYKRGILLWGPPGGGKTVAIELLMKDLVNVHKGIVLVCDSPKHIIEAIRILRRIEKNRPIIVVLEDIDEIIYTYGEHGILSLLDGEHQVDNIVHIATTNYPEKLGARIINRPSRFDERIKIGMPSAETRKVYLERTTKGELNKETIEKWVHDSKDFSIAHLRELVVAVLCLEQNYDEVIGRLKAMMQQLKGDDDGFERKKVGFGNKN